MEQIVIIKPDNSTVPLASKRLAARIRSAKQNISLLGDDIVNISIEAPIKQKYEIGDKIEVFGRIYKMNRLPNIKKTGNYGFVYDLEFEGIQYDLMRATYDLTIDTTNNELQDVQGNSLMSNLKNDNNNGFAQVLISNVNRVMPGQWELGECPDDSEYRNLTFSETDNCLSVLQMLCEEYDTEFEIQQNGGINVINFQKAGQVFPFTFEYGKGKGLYALDRQKVSSSNIVTRLKIYGSTKNITNKYRSQRLCLPEKTKGQSFIEKEEPVSQYGIWEATKYFEDIYPRRTGYVTALGDSILKFSDTDMFDLNAKESDGETTKYLLPGVSAKIHFNTGNLAGYEFDIHDYDHATKTFTLVQFEDERGEKFPSEKSTAFQFQSGDEYKLLDIALPKVYEDDAEQELLEKGEIYYDQNSQPKVQYGLSVDERFLENLTGIGSVGNIIMVGDYIPIKDDDINVDKTVRVRAFTRDLIRKYNYTLTISDTLERNITNRVISDLIDIDKIITTNNLKDPTHARANWRSSRELLNMIFDPDGDYYSEKIKPESIDTLALSVGAKSMQFGLSNTVLEPNYNGNKNKIKVQGGVLTHYTIDKDTAVSWMLADNTTTFVNNETAYYIYAKCSKSDNSGAIIFSSTQIKTEEESGYYHFWIGVVNSVDTELNVRSVALSYGFTMVNGRFIKTGRIESSGDGNTYFDLDAGEIGGRIVFTSNGEKKTLDQLGEESLESKDFINNTLPGLLSEIQGQIDGQIKQYFEDYDPTTSNEPANSWNATEKEEHLGDLFYNTDTGKVWRWVKSGSIYKWQELQDTELAEALSLANDALELAKTKNTIFTATPFTPYQVGDLWVQGASGGIFRCKTTRLTGSYSSSDWELASNYTDDSSLNSFITNVYDYQIDNLVDQIDGKIETWFQTTDPSTAWTNEALKHKHIGDMWYNTSTKLLKRYSYINGIYTWITIEDQKAIDAYQAASEAQDTADGKRRVFVATPYPPYDIGDLWVNGTDLRRCSTAKAVGQYYNINDWVIAVHYDNTKTTIDGGIVTSGTIQLAGSGGSILAGITGQGTASSSIRIWAGSSFENRATAPFKVMQDGSVVMSQATVEGVVRALSGSIGGFEVANGRIGVAESDAGGSNAGLSMLTSLLKYSDAFSWTGIGTNVFPESLGLQCLARHELDKRNSSYPNGVALYTSAKFPNDNLEYWYERRSIWNDGNMYSVGGHALFDDKYIGQAYTDILENMIGVTHQYVFTSIALSLLPMRLPKQSQVTSKAGTSNVTFDVEIIVAYNVSNRIRITSQTGAQLYNNDGVAIEYVEMAKGDALILRYYNGGWYQVIRSY